MQTPGDRRHEGRGRDLDGGRNLDGARRESRGRGQSGAALIEFALVVPLLVAILYAIVSFGV
ncbi:MAG: TadE family protein, partial [Acidimicrobiales bacterium]